MSNIIHNDYPDTKWRLVVNESKRTGKTVVEACMPIDYDGVLYISSEERQYVSYKKNSTYNLSVSEVIDRYEEKTGAEITRCEMCKEWPAGAQEDGEYLSSRFCSAACEVRHDHLKDNGETWQCDLCMGVHDGDKRVA